MSLLLDDRIGSNHYEGALARAGVPPVVKRLDSADAIIIGDGAVFGVEIKKLGDLLRTIHDGRFAGYQLPLLRASFGADCALLIEGLYRRGDGGAIEVRRGDGWETPKWAGHTSYDGLRNWILSMQFKARLQVIETPGAAGTVTWLARMHAWAARYQEHRSHVALNTINDGDDAEWETAELNPTQAFLVAKTFKGVKPVRAKALALHFRSPRRLVNATVEELVKVDGIGKKIAADFVAACEREG